jgi:hypothetical protein
MVRATVARPPGGSTGLHWRAYPASRYTSSTILSVSRLSGASVGKGAPVKSASRKARLHVGKVPTRGHRHAAASTAFLTDRGKAIARKSACGYR